MRYCNLGYRSQASIPVTSVIGEYGGDTLDTFARGRGGFMMTLHGRDRKTIDPRYSLQCNTGTEHTGFSRTVPRADEMVYITIQAICALAKQTHRILAQKIIINGPPSHLPSKEFPIDIRVKELLIRSLVSATANKKTKQNRSSGVERYDFDCSVDIIRSCASLILTSLQELTIKSVADVEAFPLLDSLHWELLRLFPAVPFFFKTAKMDVVVPTSSGQQYQVQDRTAE